MIKPRHLWLATTLVLVACGQASSESADNASQPKAASAASTAKAGNARPQVVSIITSKSETLPLWLEAQGHIVALDEVEIRPQKAGMIKQVHVREGQDVKAGALLFSLDARDDEAAVKKAEAALLSAKAQLASDQRILERNKELAAKNFISANTLDPLQSKVETGAANVAQQQAALDSVRVQQSYTRVLAPFDGRIGLINVRPGSMVQTNSTTALVKLTRIDPIGVTFTLPERELPRVLAAREGMKVRIDLSNGQSAHGRVIFHDNSVDKTAGTITLKASIQNSKQQLWPGQYAAVKIEAGTLEHAIALPAQAVQNNPNGKFVYVVQPDQTVKQVPVTVAQIINERAVVQGLDAGQKVVLEGGQNLRPGGKVSIASGTAGRNGKGRRASAASR